MLTRIRMGNLKTERKIKMRRKMWVSLGVAAAMLIMVISSWNIMMPAPATITTDTAAAKPAIENLAYAMVAVDINPSFVMGTDKDGTVISVQAKNKDAENFEDTASLVNIPAGEAVGRIIDWAQKNNYLKTNDDQEDLVLVTTYIEKDNDPDADKNQEKIEKDIQTALEQDQKLADTTNVYLMKTAKRAALEAAGKSIPLGLYVIQGQITVNGELKKVSDVVNNETMMKVLNARSTFVKSRNTVAKEARAATNTNPKETPDTNSGNGKDKGKGNDGTTGKPTTPPGQTNKQVTAE